MWSVGRNRGFGSSASPPECGPGSKTAAPGQARARLSVVQGEKLWSWVKPWWREMWSEERNYGLGSSTGGGKCGPGGETAAPGQARVPGSSPPPPECGPWEQNRGPGSSPCPQVTPGPARAWSSHLKYKKESKTNI